MVREGNTPEAQPTINSTLRSLHAHFEARDKLDTKGFLADVYQIQSLGFDKNPKVGNLLTLLGGARREIIGNSVVGVLQQAHQTGDVAEMKKNIAALDMLGLGTLPAVSNLIDALTRAHGLEEPSVQVETAKRPVFSRRYAVAGGGLALAGVLVRTVASLGTTTKETPIARKPDSAATNTPLKARPTTVPSLSAVPATVTRLPEARPTIPPPTPRPEPTKPTEVESSITSEILISRLEDEALKRRAERRSKNPVEYDKRVNPILNKNRINIVLFGYGAMKWYEASGAQSTQAFRGSQSILSIDTRTGKIDVITPTGQTMAPEVRKYQLEKGQKDAKFDWVDKAYHTGGFDLQQLVIEDMTGLSADFQVVLQDSAIKSLVDKVFLGLKMDVPTSLETMPFMLDDVEYPQGKFTKGEHVLNGVEVVQYIKALAKSFVEGQWILDAEPNPRKHQIFRNMMKAFEENKFNPLFWFRLKSFVDNNSAQKKVATDFDVASMITSALSPGAAFSMIGKKIEGKQPPSKLSINKTIFMQDPNTGADGGVSWIQASTSPYIKKAIQEGLVADPHDSVPYTPNANPFSSNLVDDYWKSTRELVEKKLLQAA